MTQIIAKEESQSRMFKDAVSFSQFIEMTAKEHAQTYTETIIEYCDNRALEPDAVARLITPALKGKIQMELIELGLLPEIGTLGDL